MSDDRPQDQGGPDGRQPDQGGPSSSPYPGAGEQPSYSLSKGGDAPETGYGYGPPSYGDQPAPTDPPAYGGQPTYGGDQPTYGGDQPAYAGQPGYGDQPTYAAPSTGYDPAAGYDPSGPNPAGGYGAGYGTPPAGGYGATAPPKKKRTGLIIGLIAGGVVVLLVVVIGLFALVAGGGGKPSETVQAYLQALSDGNAAKALDQGEKPSDTTFATGTVLKAQQDIAKITAIDVSDGYSSGNRARVTATYKFGDKQADESFSLTKIGGDWKLDDTVYPIDLTDLDDVPGLTLFGIDASSKDKAYVFPGPLVWGSSNEYLSVKESDADDFTLSPSDGTFSFSTLDTGLSDAGEKAVAEAVTTYIDTCAKSKDVDPADCPQSEYDYDAVDGTATWKAPDDLSALEYRTGSPVTSVYVSGDLTWSVTYTSEDYNGARKTVTDTDVDGSLYGTVDLTKSPPVYSE